MLPDDSQRFAQCLCKEQADSASLGGLRGNEVASSLPVVINAVGVNPWIAAGDGLSVAGARCDELQCSHYHLREG